jgi:hypothetical protein
MKDSMAYSSPNDAVLVLSAGNLVRKYKIEVYVRARDAAAIYFH